MQKYVLFLYLIVVIGLFLYYVVCAVSIFNSRSWAAYQSCYRSLSSILKCDYHDYPWKNVGGTKQGPNRSYFFKGRQLKTSLLIFSVSGVLDRFPAWLHLLGVGRGNLTSGVPVSPPSLLVELCRPCAQLWQTGRALHISLICSFIFLFGICQVNRAVNLTKPICKL